MYKIAAYITAYKDTDAVDKCIQLLNKQSYPIDKIFVIDNSPTQLKLSFLNQENVIIQFHPENIGIAKGINIALRWAFQEEYDFLWTFDQDSEPEPDALEQLLLYFDKLSKPNFLIGIIAPLVIDAKSGQELEGAIFCNYKFLPASSLESLSPRNFFHRDFYQCDIVITSGSLVNLHAAKNIPFINESLFIDSVDWDYCMKFREQGYHVVVAVKSVLKHNFGAFKDFISPNQDQVKTPVYTYTPLRYYYTCRNHTYIESRLAWKSGYILRCIIFRVVSFTKKSIKIILYEYHYKPLKIWACFRGTLDGFLGQLGKTW